MNQIFYIWRGNHSRSHFKFEQRSKPYEFGKSTSFWGKQKDVCGHPVGGEESSHPGNKKGETRQTPNFWGHNPLYKKCWNNHSFVCGGKMVQKLNERMYFLLNLGTPALSRGSSHLDPVAGNPPSCFLPSKGRLENGDPPRFDQRLSSKKWGKTSL